MVKEELIKRSPLRILERSTNGGLGTGNIGIIAAPKGLGKTACLVHIATDQLMQDRHVIHVSFARDTSHIISWYEDIFAEMSRRYRLDCAMELHDHIIRNRVIMNFRQDDLPVQRIERSIEILEDNGAFHANTLVIDGFDFTRAQVADLVEIREFARRKGYEAWLSATTSPGSGMPRELLPFAAEIAVVVCLEAAGSHVKLHLVKDHDARVPAETHLELDPRHLLISGE